MNELLALRRLFTETLLTEINKQFRLSNMTPLTDAMFFFCVGIGLFNVFRSLGTRSFGTDFLRFILKAWLAYGLVYGNASLSAYFGGKSGEPLYMTLYYKLADIGTKLEQEISDSGDDEAGLAYKTEQLISFQDNLVDSLINCDSDDASYKECMTSYLKNGVPPPEIAKAEKQEWTLLGTLTGYDQIVWTLNKIGWFYKKVYTNPAFFVFPVAQFLFGLVSAMASFGLLLFWGIVTSFAILMTQVLTPLMLLPGKEGAVKDMYKTFFSTALYGLAMKIIIWVANIILAGLLKATNEIMIDKLISSVNESTTPVGKGAIVSLMMGNFMVAFGILCIQIAAMIKVPKIARQIMFLSLSEIVNIGETLLQAGMAMAGQLTALAAKVAVVVGTAGAGAAAMGASSIGGGLAKSVASKAGSMASSLAAKAGSKTSGMGANLGSKLNNFGNRAGNLMGDNAFGNATKSGFSRLGRMTESAGQKAEAKINAMPKKAESILKREFGMDDDNEPEDNSGSKGSSSGSDGSSEKGSNSAKGKKEKKEGYLKQAFKSGGSKTQSMISSLNKQAWSATSVGMGGDGSGTELVEDAVGAVDGTVSEMSKAHQSSLNEKRQAALSPKESGDAPKESGDAPKESGDAPIDTSKPENDGFELENNMTAIGSMGGKNFSEESEAEYAQMKQNIQTGNSSEEEMEKFRAMSESHNLSNEQEKDYLEMQKNIPELGKMVQENDAKNATLINEMKLDYKYGQKIDDAKLQSLLKNSDSVTRNNRNDPEMRKILDNVLARDRARIKEKINKMKTDPKNISNKEKQQLLRFQSNEHVQRNMDKSDKKDLKSFLNDAGLLKTPKKP